MFATMIIVLPSQYEGGAVQLSHAGDTRTFDFSSTSMTHTSVLAWYTDVMHQVKPVTSGYRLALSYNLIQTKGGIPPSLPDMSASASALRQVLGRWHKGLYDEGADTELLAYVFDHSYSADDLASGLIALKGKDAVRALHLKVQADKVGYRLCFGSLDFHVAGETDDQRHGYKRGRYYNSSSDVEFDDNRPVRIVNEQARDYTVYELVDCNGKNLLPENVHFEITQDQLSPEDAFEGEAPDEEDIESYTGNVSLSVFMCCPGLILGYGIGSWKCFAT